VDCAATVTVLSGAGVIQGQMVDLGRGGCRLKMAERVAMDLLTRVEVCFSLRGMAFRIVGVTVGTRPSKNFAVRFLDMPARRSAELAEVLGEIEANPEGPAAAPKAELEPPMAGVARKSGEMAESGAKAGAETVPAAGAERVAAPKTGGQRRGERRQNDRHAVDTRVNLTMVRGAITMRGCILNLSLGGCRLRTDERFHVGIYTRVEAEFYLHGLPFRLAGVIQAILDRNTIGVRFLDISERKREQLTELIAELEEELGTDVEGNLREG